MPQPWRPFGEHVILAFKFRERFPNWLQEMAEAFNLAERPSAK